MGMNYYAETGYGLFLTDNEMMIFAKRMCEKDGQKFEEVEEEDLIDLLYDLPDSILVSDNDFAGRDVFFLDKDGCTRYFVDHSGLMLFAKKQGSIVKEKEDKLYNDLDDMAKEFSDRYGKYLPDNFDIKSRLCYFAGAIFLQSSNSVEEKQCSITHEKRQSEYFQLTFS